MNTNQCQYVTKIGPNRGNQCFNDAESDMPFCSDCLKRKITLGLSYYIEKTIKGYYPKFEAKYPKSHYYIDNVAKNEAEKCLFDDCVNLKINGPYCAKHGGTHCNFTNNTVKCCKNFILSTDRRDYRYCENHTREMGIIIKW